MTEGRRGMNKLKDKSKLFSTESMNREEIESVMSDLCLDGVIPSKTVEK